MLNKILVIKLGALGDFIQALGPMAAIRRAHPEAHITLLTTAPFKNFGQDCGYFDEIIIDEKPKSLNIVGWMKLKKQLNACKFDRVYDLQNNDRTAFYFSLFNPRPEWVGAVNGASHQNASPERTAGHAFDGHVQTLALAGITDVQVDQLDWMNEDISHLRLQPSYALLVPGSSPKHPQKRWPASSYGSLAKALIEKQIQPVVLGTNTEEDLAKSILETCPDALDLTGKTSLKQIATLARKAKCAIGNDTGPMHLIAATGCPSLVLFSGHSNPVKHQPKGKNSTILQQNTLSDLSVDEVIKKLNL